MNQLLLKSLLMAFVLVGSGELAAQESPPRETLKTTVVVPTGTNSPADLAKTLERVFAGDVEMTVTPLLQQSALVIRASAEDQAQILELVNSILPQFHLIRIHTMLLESNSTFSANERAMLNGPIPQVTEAIEGLKRSGKIEVLNDIELTLLPEMRTRLQVGDRIAISSGVSQAPGGRQSKQYEWVEIGTALMLTGTIDQDHVVLSLDFEKSFQRPVQESADGESPRGISTLTHQSTLRIPSGQAQLAGIMMDRMSNAQSISRVLVVAVEKL